MLSKIKHKYNKKYKVKKKYLFEYTMRRVFIMFSNPI